MKAGGEGDEEKETKNRKYDKMGEGGGNRLKMEDIRKSCFSHRLRVP
jgi:hypothetical protein